MHKYWIIFNLFLYHKYASIISQYNSVAEAALFCGRNYKMTKFLFNSDDRVENCKNFIEIWISKHIYSKKTIIPVRYCIGDLYGKALMWKKNHNSASVWDLQIFYTSFHLNLLYSFPLSIMVMHVYMSVNVTLLSLTQIQNISFINLLCSY